MSTPTLDTSPITHSVVVDCPPQRAFDVFTGQIGEWWPLETYSVGDGAAETAIMESHAGGELYERSAGGDRAHWATVTVWDPPNRVVLAWQVNPEAPAATEIDVRFTALGTSTRVELEHRNWELLGAERGAAARSGYQGGWPTVLGRYAEAVGG